jgi:hypothetical protein
LSPPWLAGQLAAAPPPSPATGAGGGTPTSFFFEEFWRNIGLTFFIIIEMLIQHFYKC